MNNPNCTSDGAEDLVYQKLLISGKQQLCSTPYCNNPKHWLILSAKRPSQVKTFTNNAMGKNFLTWYDKHEHEGEAKELLHRYMTRVSADIIRKYVRKVPEEWDDRRTREVWNTCFGIEKGDVIRAKVLFDQKVDTFEKIIGGFTNGPRSLLQCFRDARSTQSNILSRSKNANSGSTVEGSRKDLEQEPSTDLPYCQL